MTDKLLIVSDRESDSILLEGLLRDKGFTVLKTSFWRTVEENIHKNSCAAIVVDMDYAGRRILQWLEQLHNNKSGAFLIVYGDNKPAEQISELFQKGIFGFIPRRLLSGRIGNTIDEGMKNRDIFHEIMEAMDELAATNKKLIRERKALKSRNEALTFINRLSHEIAYDVNWNRIIQKMMDAGLSSVIDVHSISLLYRNGAQWNLDLYLPDKGVDIDAVKSFQKEILEKFFAISHMNLFEEEIIVRRFPTKAAVEKGQLPALSDHLILLLNSADTHLGMFTLLGGGKGTIDPLKKELVSTIATILSMSLKNAQDYQNLKKMSTRDELTGLMNREGFEECFDREFQKTRRFEKPLSLIMLEVDNLKAVNNSLGHQAGDHMLKEFAKCLKEPLRKTDIVCRFAIDKFSVLLPETEIEKAEIIIKRLLSAIQCHELTWQSKPVKVKTTFGISATNEPGPIENGDDLILRAIDRCYRSKRSANHLYSMAI